MYPLNNLFQQAKYSWKCETLYPSSDSPNKAVNSENYTVPYQTLLLFVCLQPEWRAVCDRELLTPLVTTNKTPDP